MYNFSDQSFGNVMHDWCKTLFPITRSITGKGVRTTLEFIDSTFSSDLTVYCIESGTKVFDWTVPDEWNIYNAYVLDPEGNVIINLADSNLHIVSYSVPVDIDIDLDDLLPRLFSLPYQPNAIPYVTSYYRRSWGFCLEHSKKILLKAGTYHVHIDSTLEKGHLNYGEVFLPGLSSDEILISTYICHPSLANNELSGPVVTCALISWLESSISRRYSYRFVFVPETIGSLVFLSRSLDHLKKHVIAGFNVTCVGDDRAYSYLPSRRGDSLSDIVALHVLKFTDKCFKSYQWTDRGSDERQYCSPNVDLPIASIMRSKYGAYPEYHTSLDDLSVVTASGLFGSFTALSRALYIIENNFYPISTVIGEPQLGRRGLYPTTSIKMSSDNASEINIARTYLNIISYADGSYSILDISNILNIAFWDLFPFVITLLDAKLLLRTEQNK